MRIIQSLKKTVFLGMMVAWLLLGFAPAAGSFYPFGYDVVDQTE